MGSPGAGAHTQQDGKGPHPIGSYCSSRLFSNLSKFLLWGVFLLFFFFPLLLVWGFFVLVWLGFFHLGWHLLHGFGFVL